MPSQECPKEGRIKSVEELKSAYPYGMMIYYQADVTRHEQLTRVLSEALPGLLVTVTNKIMFLYPNDCGLQLGNKFYNDGSGRSYCFQMLKDMTDLTPEQIYQVIPSDETPHIEGGLLIPVPASRVIAYACYEPEQAQTEDKAIRRHGFKPLLLEKTCAGLKNFVAERNLGKNEEWIYQLDTAITHFPRSHIDTVITGFKRANFGFGSMKWYVDEPLLDYLRKHNLIDPPLKRSQPFPHDLALQGGLNIEYVYNGTRWIAFVPSRRVIGPINNDLENFGYQVVELGEEEVSHKAGIKCRSLVISWSE